MWSEKTQPGVYFDWTLFALRSVTSCWRPFASDGHGWQIVICKSSRSYFYTYRPAPLPSRHPFAGFIYLTLLAELRGWMWTVRPRAWEDRIRLFKFRSFSSHPHHDKLKLEQMGQKKLPIFGNFFCSTDKPCCTDAASVVNKKLLDWK